MNIATLMGILLGFGSLLAGFMLGGGPLDALVMLSPAVIVLGGTIGASLISFQPGSLKKLPKILSQAFAQSGSMKILDDAVVLREVAELARINGLWSLESYLADNPELDPTLRRGISMLVDGADAKSIEDDIKSEFGVLENSRNSEIAMLETIGKYAIAMGIIGAILGMTLLTGGALLSALYGMCLAWLLCMPLAGKIKTDLKISAICRDMHIRVLVCLQEGLGSRVIDDIIIPYLEAAGVPLSWYINEFNEE